MFFFYMKIILMWSIEMCHVLLYHLCGLTRKKSVNNPFVMSIKGADFPRKKILPLQSKKNLIHFFLEYNNYSLRICVRLLLDVFFVAGGSILVSLAIRGNIEI